MMEVYAPQEDSFLLSDEIKKFSLKGKKCLDMGTGSGIEAEAMAKVGASEITCVDVNYKALLASQKKLSPFSNVVKLKFIEGSLFEKLHDEKFDFIAFNPPYLPSDDTKFIDLDGGKKGREVIDKFIEQLPMHVSVGGYLLLLVSSLNGEKEVLNVLEKKGFIAKIVAQKKLFFEVLYIISARKIE